MVPEGYKPALGELIMIADNTGFSTGIHTHMGLYRINHVQEMIQKLDTSDAEGSSDPNLYFTNKFAIDAASLKTRLVSNWCYYQYRLGF